MRKALVAMAAIALLCMAGIAQADVFNLGSGLRNLEMVTVGDPANPADTRYEPFGRGRVDYDYRIGKYEVTAGQYCDFLNQKAKSDPYGLYNPYMDTASAMVHDGCNIKRSGESGSYVYSVASDWANRPVNYVSYWDACRLVNWLSNGQGNGNTESGAYTLNGFNALGGSDIQRNPGAKWFLPSEDEWYKAAYFKGNTVLRRYWTYPTQSDTAPSNVGSDGYADPGNHANYYVNGYTIGSPYYRTNVGEFERSASAYGTFDQAGNVREWNESVYYNGDDPWRGQRGGCYNNFGSPVASTYGYGKPTIDFSDVGFRVAGTVPEPSSFIALAGGIASLLGLRRRRG